jgi:hypothetical protein
VKTLLMFVLCVPLALALGNQIRLLISAGSATGGEPPPAGRKNLDKRIETARETADFYKRIAKPIETISEEMDDPAPPVTERELVDPVKDYAKMLHDTRIAMDALQRKQPDRLPAKWKEWRDSLGPPDEAFERLQATFRKVSADQEYRKYRTLLGTQIDECRAAWLELKGKPFHPERSNLVFAYLDTASRLLDMLNRNVDDRHFDTLNKIVLEGRAKEISALARRHAQAWARDAHYWPEKAKYDAEIGVDITDPRPVGKWDKFPTTKLRLKSSEDTNWYTLSEKPELQFAPERPFTGNDIRDYTKPNNGPMGYKGRLRPTMKSVLAHAYNKTKISVTAAGGTVIGLKNQLAEHYLLAARDDDEARRLVQADPATALQLLKDHHRDLGDRLERLSHIVETCSDVFR